MRPILADGAPIARDGDRLHAILALGRTPRGQVSAPIEAHRPIVLSDAEKTGSIEIVPNGAANVPATVDGTMVSYPAAYVGADLAYVLGDDRIEELRIARSPEAADALRWTMRRRGVPMKLHAVGDHLEVVDQHGVVRYRTDAAFAVDSSARRVPVQLEVVPIDEGRDEIIGHVEELRALRYPIAIDPTWRLVASLSLVRAGHGTVALKSGKILVFGGYGDGALSSAVLFDPTTETWSAASSMNEKRAFPAATLLPSGKLFVVGGCRGLWYETDSAEIYDETTDTWTTASSAPTAHGYEGPSSALLLPSGKVMLSGPSAAEIYDPATDKWSAGPDNATGYKGGLLTLLASGKVLATASECPAGSWPAPSPCAQIFDLSTTKAVATPNMAVARVSHSAILLPSGKVLVAGGMNWAFAYGGGVKVFASTEYYDPGTNSWSTGPSMGTPRYAFASTLLSSGRWLVAGTDVVEPQNGVVPATAEAFDPIALKWLPVPSMREGHGRASMAALSDGRALIVGGEGFHTAPWFGGVLSSKAEILDVKCIAGSDCPSGFCVDGVCCDKACTGPCVACDEPTKIGTCSPITGVPRLGRPTCGAFLCKSGACATTCSSSADCLDSAPCLAGTCKLKGKGEKCSADVECASHECWDGVCCNGPCFYACVACNLPGKVGTCDIVTGVPRVDSKRVACGKDPECAPRCDGRAPGGCDTPAPAASTACGGGCTAGIAMTAGTCDGIDTCSGTKTVCEPYACDTTVCKTTCTTGSDCAPGFNCVASKCSKLGCSPDGTTAYAEDGTPKACTPYKCSGFACLDSCKSKADCADGFVCEGTACVPPTTPDTGVDAPSDTPTDAPIDAIADASPEATDEAPSSQSLYGCGMARSGDAMPWFLLALLAVARSRRIIHRSS